MTTIDGRTVEITINGIPLGNVLTATVGDGIDRGETLGVYVGTYGTIAPKVPRWVMLRARRRERAAHRRALMRGRREAHAMGLDVQCVKVGDCRGYFAAYYADAAQVLRTFASAVDEPWDSDTPYVCPGCYTVAVPCPSWCVDGQIAQLEADRDELWNGRDEDGWNDDDARDERLCEPCEDCERNECDVHPF